MHVGLDQAGHDQTAAAIANLGVGVGPFPLPRFPIALPDLNDPSVAHGNVRPLHAPLAVVQQHIAAGEKEVRGVREGRHGLQVATRG